MEITRGDIEHVAKLSRLKLAEEEIDRFTQDFKSILNYVDKLNELDTSNVKPTYHVFPFKNILREDIVYDSYDRDLILKNAPNKEEGCYHVPKVME